MTVRARTDVTNAKEDIILRYAMEDLLQSRIHL